MKRHISFLYLLVIALLAMSLCVSCTEEEGGSVLTLPAVDDSDLTETFLSLNVASMDTSSAATKADEDEVLSDDVTADELRGTDQERRIDNIWVFQFDASTGSLLISPQYYDISSLEASPDEENGVEVTVLLKPNVASTVYVVANVNRSDWATVSNAYSLSAVKEMIIPQPDYVYVDINDDSKEFTIPMEGGVDVTPVPGDTIEVQVTRMYAKIEIELGNVPENIEVTAVDVYEIPFYCQVGSIAPDDPTDAADYSDDIIWTQHAFNPGTKDSDDNYTGTMVIYIPENLQGRNSNTSDSEEEKDSEDYEVPDHALYIDFIANQVDIFTGDILEQNRKYTVYPGENTYNDFNIKRNYIYKVTINLNTDKYDQDVASSNCYVVEPGRTITFLPYNRTETGGGYDITDYLDAYGDDETKKINSSSVMTENIQIIWQTKDAIGDNTYGNKVWIDYVSDDTDEFHRQIHVKTNEVGNALIAAYNSDGEIIWSWHIWITDNDPANVSNALVYSTYSWNEDGVKTDVRVPGYAIMPCNLGALKNEPDDINTLDPDTHGMLYQWGRKDPFPPAITPSIGQSQSEDYTDTNTGYHYANDNTTLVTKTADTDEDYLFHSVAGNDRRTMAGTASIEYTIENPTVFICGTWYANRDYVYVAYNGTAYAYQGDWAGSTHFSDLWGGEAPSTTSGMKYLTTVENVQIVDGSKVDVHIFDNYGSSKSIFDPCPDGWRVPPGDLWLGFTSTGLNPESYDEVNTTTEETGYYTGAGMYLYMNDWQSGETAFFPTQGTRVPDGRLLHPGICGNYHNATADTANRVNIMHVHRNTNNFRIFESDYMYCVKSTGGPIRCVRDHK